MGRLARSNKELKIRVKTMKSSDKGNAESSNDYQTVEDLMMANAPDFNDVMRCVFKIKDYEIEVYFYLLDNPQSTITEISKFLKKDRSSFQRSLQTLMEKKMITRKFRVLGSGGFTYIYSAIPIGEAKELMDRELKVWYGMMSNLVKNFEKR